jgi:hypothetical protein
VLYLVFSDILERILFEHLLFSFARLVVFVRYLLMTLSLCVCHLCRTNLIITVIEAKNLASRTGETSKDSPCDAYCVISLLDNHGKRIEGTAKKTHVVKNTIHPQWNVTLSLYVLFLRTLLFTHTHSPPLSSPLLSSPLLSYLCMYGSLDSCLFQCNTRTNLRRCGSKYTRSRPRW